MIVRESPEGFILISQHDHATLSGKLAEYWGEDIFWKNAYTTDVLLAIYQHDRGWINLDKIPAWDEKENKVHAFIGYPLKEKLKHYKLGIDEVEIMSTYAAILCSMHYCSFMNGNNASENFFIEGENKRQAHLKKILSVDNEEKQKLMGYHFHLLQLFDDISLYLCMNKPGVSKTEEFPFFRNGFKNSDRFAFTGGRKIEATWINNYSVAVAPFPLVKECEVAVPYKQVNKAYIQQHGLANAYLEAATQTYEVKITN